MTQNIKYKNISIRFREEGEGEPIILLHGYLESLNIWDEFLEELSKRFRVVSIDLLGHGKTGNIGQIHTMDMMADAVNFVLVHLDISKCTMIGHSMGGYVTLAFLQTITLINLLKRYVSQKK